MFKCQRKKKQAPDFCYTVGNLMGYKTRNTLNCFTTIVWFDMRLILMVLIFDIVYHQRPFLLTWFNLNPGLEK